MQYFSFEESNLNIPKYVGICHSRIWLRKVGRQYFNDT